MSRAVALLLLLAGLTACGARPAAPERAIKAPRPARPARSADDVFVLRPKAVAPLPPPVPDPPRAISPTSAAPASGAPSDAEVRRDLARALGVKASANLTDGAELTASGLAAAPPAAPDAVDAVIRAGNRVAHAPYVYGGGHGHFIDTAYDCSGSVSFALASANLLKTTMDSSSLARWGQPGAGKWITVYANAGHAFMVVAGLRFDTSGRSGPRGSRWQPAFRTVSGFTARHPAGL